MAYPTIQQYQETLQRWDLAFIDEALKRGEMEMSRLGPPVVVSGGFALTYAVRNGAQKYAVRCFHRDTASSLEQRYAAIARALRTLSSPYFVDPDYQRNGVRIGNGVYPIVKMRWASGETLGEFVENTHRDRTQLSNLMASLTRLAAHLQDNGIAHGDIQEGNLMVSNSGRQVQLIDYDGMYIPSIAALGSTEQGHRDFQHPGRQRQFNDRLDRFSFIALNLALRALCEDPDLWDESQSGAGVIVFRGSDYADSDRSAVLAKIRAIPSLRRDAESFADICAGDFDDVPSLADFVAGRYARTASTRNRPTGAPAAYVGAYDVIKAADISMLLVNEGRVVELIGKVLKVIEKTAGNRKKYHFIDFADWRSPSVQVIVWEDAKGRGRRPSDDWVGTWVSIRGLLQPIIPTKGESGPRRMRIAPESLGHIEHLTPEQAQYRLGGPAPVKNTAPQVAPRPAPIPESPRAPASVSPAAATTARLPVSSPTVPGPAKVLPQASSSTSLQQRNEEAMKRMRQQAAMAQAQAQAVRREQERAAVAASAAAQRAAVRAAPPPVVPSPPVSAPAVPAPPIRSPTASEPPPFAACTPPMSLARQWPGAAPPLRRGVLGWLRSLFGR